MSGERLDILMSAARKQLRDVGLDTPDLDARLLVEWATGKTRLDLISAPEQLIDSEAVENLYDALDRRVKGEPVHRIMGVRDFSACLFGFLQRQRTASRYGSAGGAGHSDFGSTRRKDEHA